MTASSPTPQRTWHAVRQPDQAPATMSGDGCDEEIVHIACPTCNSPDGPFVTTLCGLAQGPTEQVPPIGPVCEPCRRVLPIHECDVS